MKKFNPIIVRYWVKDWNDGYKVFQLMQKLPELIVRFFNDNRFNTAVEIGDVFIIPEHFSLDSSRFYTKSPADVMVEIQVPFTLDQDAGFLRQALEKINEGVELFIREGEITIAWIVTIIPTIAIINEYKPIT